jgi:hypothetical protein
MVKRGWRIRLITSPPSVSLFCRQCGILSISQPCKPPWFVTGIALLFFFVPYPHIFELLVFCIQQAYVEGICAIKKCFHISLFSLFFPFLDAYCVCETYSRTCKIAGDPFYGPPEEVLNFGRNVSPAG